MLISVVVPFFNEIHLINRAVKSVFVQIEDNDNVEFEILIGNDGPYTNNEIINSIEAKYRDIVRIVKNQNLKGPGPARNCGLEVAKGDLIAFLDADDFWLPGKIKLQLDLYIRGFNFIATAYVFDSVDVVILPPKPLIDDKLNVFKSLGIGTSTLLIASDLIKNMRFRNLRFSQDIDFWHRLSLQANFSFVAVNKSLVVYSTGGSTSNKFEQARSFWRVMSLNKISPFSKFIFFCNYAIRGVFNHLISRLH